MDKEISETFYWLIGDLKGSEAEEFLEDFLTPEEKLMLSKRLSVALLVHEGFDYPEIKELLKVSNGTISGVKHWLRYKKGFRLGLRKLKRREKSEESEKRVKELLKHLPPLTKSAKDRARWLNR